MIYLRLAPACRELLNGSTRIGPALERRTFDSLCRCSAIVERRDAERERQVRRSWITVAEPFIKASFRIYMSGILHITMSEDTSRAIITSGKIRRPHNNQPFYLI